MQGFPYRPRPKPGDPDPGRYRLSQAFALQRRWPDNEDEPASGIVYDSVRHDGGTVVCLVAPMLVRLPVVQGEHYEYRWDAQGNRSVVKLTEIAP